MAYLEIEAIQPAGEGFFWAEPDFEHFPNPRFASFARLELVLQLTWLRREFALH
jgi:hypothetical protein